MFDYFDWRAAGFSVGSLAALGLVWGLLALFLRRRREIRERLQANEAALRCRHGKKIHDSTHPPCVECAKEFKASAQRDMKPKMEVTVGKVETARIEWGSGAVLADNSCSGMQSENRKRDIYIGTALKANPIQARPSQDVYLLDSVGSQIGILRVDICGHIMIVLGRDNVTDVTIGTNGDTLRPRKVLVNGLMKYNADALSARGDIRATRGTIRKCVVCGYTQPSYLNWFHGHGGVSEYTVESSSGSRFSAGQWVRLKDGALAKLLYPLDSTSNEIPRTYGPSWAIDTGVQDGVWRWSTEELMEPAIPREGEWWKCLVTDRVFQAIEGT